jgi:SSS family solute:Na+ symporter
MRLVDQPLISGLLTAGILAAIMSSLDSQFVCLGSMFTHDIVVHAAGPDRFSDGQKIALGRAFIVFIVAVVYALSLLPQPHIFDLGVWCFTGFSSLFPLVFAALYWRRVTRAGAIACVLVMAVAWAVLFHRGLLGPLMAGDAIEGDYLVLGAMPVTFTFAASAVALVVVSLLTSPPPARIVDKFFADARTQP